MVVLLRLSVTRFVTAYGVSCHIGQEQARLSYPGGTHHAAVTASMLGRLAP